MAFRFKYEQKAAFFHVKTWPTWLDIFLKNKKSRSKEVYKNTFKIYDEKKQKLQKKIGDSRIPEGIWSLETIRHTRG